MKKYGEGTVIPEDGDPKDAEWTDGDRQELSEEMKKDSSIGHGEDCDCFRCDMAHHDGDDE